MLKSMLTTVDNPHDPFLEFEEWYAFDERMKYHTSSFLARMTITSHELSVVDQNLANELAIDEIIEENISGIYKKVSIEVDDSILIE